MQKTVRGFGSGWNGPNLDSINICEKLLLVFPEILATLKDSARLLELSHCRHLLLYHTNDVVVNVYACDESSLDRPGVPVVQRACVHPADLLTLGEFSSQIDARCSRSLRCDAL